ncbi:MAG: acyl-[acyl-carrier-protein]--UDP-N-acetylglucosamine O-acyltransferase [Omnitrophica bacterium RIFCSPLOWO2_12_FULL_44_17]|uniref:Acyl-[acyl-carrier-protein]--UDP-N-acetylglucosamine O-acyltransferase n=1 Tax=Candidatus Danuiimicrobium aquiferis TaxID=1801832 RepID=A0A1G1L288_9BACT|nr:MAG: acyl-[acyl-carrier-protein]--UDP-N-acetylglucosamine O-acyltransferase [Omnitrophica bacterium RIFCSPHIGHO2_02_FULL_45_28]OGW89949.1 MAG: acyl-[acyl-carrier-protein]--UDP-N-acetylglucosamine O-acyltransferase [Omnitrophica bacterium RIFCSPHIGHO2_12_FULL_44_12]OGW98999.1 MAG: acyl-[acyl-carrier-protein]--UDP-N-acetylglucosamine O-acyltransferase [Omnitrophica bacterium RIFCSPLOWO2_12_FULL_44_17]OGX04178.1 MAG: acyl-[acyl-carrier-protein]--UDP-N-acetylglucosamine O-acyltransferase [Omnitro
MGIHTTAIIGKNSIIPADNDIGPYVIIEDGVQLGTGNKILSHAYIATGAKIGNNNQIHMGAVVGHAPQDLAYQGAPTGTRIGNHNVIREYVTIHRGTKEGTETVIGNHNYLMANVHIAHNCQIGNRVIIVNGAGLAGYCKVDDGAFLSGMTVFHQFTSIGSLAMVSALSGINKDIPPYMLCGGRPATVYGVNTVGMRRAGISAAAREEIKQAYKILYRSGMNFANALTEIERKFTSPEIKCLIEFVKNSKRGITSGSEIEEEEESLRF